MITAANPKIAPRVVPTIVKVRRCEAPSAAVADELEIDESGEVEAVADTDILLVGVTFLSFPTNNSVALIQRLAD